MPLDFKPLSMMDLRSTPGDVLDRVADKGEAFIVERNGYQMACLVPLRALMPDIQQSRLAHELEQLRNQNEAYTTSITDEHEIEMSFPHEGTKREVIVTIRMPHGYPNVCPKVFAKPIPDSCPHRWQDGSLCIFGATEIWNPGQHDILYVLGLTRHWLTHFAAWQKKGQWDWSQENG